MRRSRRTPAAIRDQLRRSRVALYSVTLPMLAAFSIMGVIDSFLRLLYILLGFSLIIFLHELGHFLVARWCSVKCLAFSIGIGPRMCGWRKGGGFSIGSDPFDPESKKHKHAKTESAAVQSDLPTALMEPAHPATVGDTDYRVSWLPLGGYVRMLGQDDMDPTKLSDDPQSFNRRPIWQRMCIVSAGVIMNVIFAAVVFSIIFSPGVGVNFPPAVIGSVHYGMPAWGHLELGDEVLMINGKQVRRGRLEFTDLLMSGALSSGTEPIELQVRKAATGAQETLSLMPRRSAQTGFLALGVESLPGDRIAASLYREDDEFALRAKDPAFEANLAALKDLEAGYRIAKVDEVTLPVPSEDPGNSGSYAYPVLYRHVQSKGDVPLTLTLQGAKDPNLPEKTVTIIPHIEPVAGAEGYPAVFGLAPRILFSKPLPGRPAEKGGLRAGDRVLRVGDRNYPSPSDVVEVISGSRGSPVIIEVERAVQEAPVATGAPGAEMPQVLEIKRIEVVPARTKGGAYRIGVGFDQDLIRPMYMQVAPNSELESLNLGPQTTIVALDGAAVRNWQDIYREVRTRKPGDGVRVTFMPGDGREALSVSMTLTEQEHAAVTRQLHYQMGLVLENQTFRQRADNAGQAMLMGVDHTKKFILQVYMTLAGLFRQTISADNLHGIVGITKIGYDVQARGMVWLWYVLAMVSVNLAVANFLPLPIVDGGLFLLLILEKIRGKPLSLKIQSAIQVAGIVLLAGLFLFVTYNDIGLFMK